MRKIFGLVDCNSFFASCEKVFRPELKNKPVVVLSNNDGCIVARSGEAKELGIPMGIPYFKFKNELNRHKVNVFSSNYELYGDMSRRVMNLLYEFTPNVEIYSIDEAFLDLTNILVADLDRYGRNIKNQVVKATGIPISVGIASTKTLAKVATKIAKTNKILDGVLDISKAYQNVIDSYLKKVEVGDVWGIGRKNSVKLELMGIKTAYDLKYMNLKEAQKLLTVTGLRTVMELNEIPCIPLDQNPEPKKTIASTRSFGKAITTRQELSESVSFHVARACEKLRQQNSMARVVTVFIMTSPFNQNERFYFNSLTVQLPVATSYTPEMTKYALKSLNRMFIPNKNYKRAGVIVGDISSSNDLQFSLFKSFKLKEESKENRLMQSLDRINRTFGIGTIKCLSEGIDKRWRMKRNLLSKRFTTNWDELLTVNV